MCIGAKYLKLKIFTFRFSETSDGFDDSAMQGFMADKEVIEYTEHFFVHEKTPYLTIVLSYRDIAQDEKKRYNQRQDPRKELDEQEKIMYDALRNWRAARAKQEGIPPYMIANNKQNFNNSIDIETWQRSMSSLLGHIQQVNTRNLRATFFQRSGAKGALTA
jgi:hypothetical protein